MEINNGQVIYPQNLKKYSGSIYGLWSRAKNIKNEFTSFCVHIKSTNFKYQKYYPSIQEAESELVRLNQENRLEIKNTMRDCGDHYLVKLNGNKNFLADKCDLPFIEAYIWFSDAQNYVCCKQNGRKIKFHNLILNHIPSTNATVDHFNRCPFDNRRVNLRIVTQQTQSINRNPRNKAIQPGVSSDKNRWYSTWLDEKGVRKTATFNINKYGYEAAKQLAVTKRLEIELSLNHYRLALHNLPPLWPNEEQGELEPNDEQGELEPNVPDDEQDEM